MAEMTAQEEKALEQLRKDRKKAEQQQPREADIHQVIRGLREEITILRGELDVAVNGDRIILDRQQHLDRTLTKQDQLRRQHGEHEWWLHDRRNKKKPPVKFYSSATTPQAAYSDYQQRTGHRFVGQGSNPFFCKQTAEIEN